MRCARADQIDVAAYLADPRDARWRDFAAHFPDCDDCTDALERWTRLEQALEAESTASHPETDLLFAFVESEPLADTDDETVDSVAEG